MQYQIHQSHILKIEWQTVSRIANEVLGVKGVNFSGLNFL